jgi:hypothetical protein
LRFNKNVIETLAASAGRASGLIGLVTKGPQISKRFMLIKHIDESLTPDSPFPDKSKAKTFREYLSRRNKIEMLVDKQPMVEVNYISTRSTFQQQPKASSASKNAKENRYKILYPAEYLIVMPFKESEFNLTMIIPDILHRANCLLKVRKFQYSIESLLVDKLNIEKVMQIESINVSESNDRIDF